MIWKIEYLASVKKDIQKFDHQTRKRIREYLENRIALLNNPRDNGAALKGCKFDELWKYRIGDYRVICKIHDNSLTILAVKIGHRREVYK